MKKYTKIIGIVLCFALLIGILPLTATADPEPTTWLDLIPESTIESIAGYYVDGDMDYLTDEDPDEGGYLTDAHIGTGGWMHGCDWPAPDGAVPAVVFDLGETKTVGAMELIARTNYGLTDYTIEAYTDNGWEAVQNVAVEFHGNTQFVTFDAVECSQVRILIADWDGDHPMLQEVSIYEVKTTTPLVQIPVAGVVANQNPTVASDSVENVIDGDRYSIYQIGAGNMPVQITFDTTNDDGSANNFSRMTIFAFRADRSTIAEFTVEVQGEPNGDWTQVHTGTAYAQNHTDTFVLDLAQSYKAYAVRLTVSSSTAQGLCLPEVRLFGNGETYEAPYVPTPGEYEIVSGQNLTIPLENTDGLETLSFEYKLTSGTFNMALMMPDVDNYFGYFAFDQNGNVSLYDGVTVEDLGEENYRVTLTVADLNKMTGSPDGSVDSIYIRGNWTDGNGIIRNIVVNGAGGEEPTEPSEPAQPTMPEGTAVPKAPVVSVGSTTIENGVTIEGDVYKFIPKSIMTAQFGYYNAGGTFVDGNDGSCVIDGWYGRAGYSECTTSQGQMALILTLSETKLIGAMDICPRGGYPNNAPESFEIQVMIGGNWVTAVTVTENAFTTTSTVRYTFPAVETNQVRVLIHSVAGGASQPCYLDEIELYEVTTGKLYNDIDLNGKVTDSNAFGNNPASNLTDGDRTSNTTGSNYTINLTDAEGNPTSIDGYRMYFHRGNAAIIQNLNVMIQTVPGGDFESIGAFPAGWSSGDPRENCVVEFEQTYVAYAIKLNMDTNAPNHEFELFQYQKTEAPEGPEQPTEPSAPATEPSAPATEPSAPATEPSAPATEPSAPATEPSAPATEPEATEPEATDPTDPEDIYDQFDLTELENTFALIDTLDLEGYTEESLEELAYAIEIAFLVLMDENLTQEMIDEVNAMLLEAIDNLVPVDSDTETPELPDVPALPSTDALFTTISTITNLNPSEYTAESYAALIEAVDIVNAMILEANGAFTQAMLDEANAILTEALAGLVKIGGETPDGETPDDEIPGGEDSDDDNDLPADTGDVAMIILSGMMTLSAVGGAAVIGKKKFF